MAGRIYKFSNGKISDYPKNDPNNFIEQLGDISGEQISKAGFSPITSVGQEPLEQEIWSNGKNRYLVVMTLDCHAYDVVVIDGFANYLEFVRLYLYPLTACYAQITD